MESNKYIIQDNNLCPITKMICDDECCPPGSVCNLKPRDSSGIQAPMSNNESKPLTLEQMLKKVTGSKIEMVCPTDAMALAQHWEKQSNADLKREVEELQRIYKLSLDVAAQLALDKHKLTDLLHEQFINPVNGNDESDWQSYLTSHGLNSKQ